MPEARETKHNPNEVFSHLGFLLSKEPTKTFPSTSPLFDEDVVLIRDSKSSFHIGASNSQGKERYQVSVSPTSIDVKLNGKAVQDPDFVITEMIASMN